MTDNSFTAHSVGVLLTNIGTPQAPSPQAVKQYLKNFLSDPRIIEAPPILWQPILRGLILPFRSRKSAKLYQKIWGSHGSPLLHYSNNIALKLQEKLTIPVALGMHYSEPSIEQALADLERQKVNKILVLPLYPHYSATTTGTTYDRVTQQLKTYRNIPEIRTIHSYSHEDIFLNALEETLKNTWQQVGKAEHLLFSFHGIPKRYHQAGDRYSKLCHENAEKMADRLKLPTGTWSIAFQSRFARLGWLTPYTDKVLAALPQSGITDLQVICPGFAVDCLETLEEIAIRGREQFLNAGGKSFRYIEALNDDEIHINMLSQLVRKHIQGW